MPAPMQGPLGQYGIARSLVQTPGWKALEAEQNEMLPNNRRGGSVSFGPAGRGMTDEERVRAYGYEGGLSQMQNDVPPSMRGIESRPNASIMLESAQANIDSGLYKDMNEAMAAQIALNKKIPQYSFAENVRRSLASQEMVKRNDQAALRQASANQALIRKQGTANSLINTNQGQVDSWTPGGSYKPRYGPLAKSSLGRDVAARNVAPVRRRSAGRGASTYSAGRSARNNFRGL